VHKTALSPRAGLIQMNEFAAVLGRKAEQRTKNASFSGFGAFDVGDETT
jgi:hypothetical protein